MAQYALSLKEAFQGRKDLRDAVHALHGIRLMWYWQDLAIVEATPEDIERLRCDAGEWIEIQDNWFQDPVPAG